MELEDLAVLSLDGLKEKYLRMTYSAQEKILTEEQKKLDAVEKCRQGASWNERFQRAWQ